MQLRASRRLAAPVGSRGRRVPGGKQAGLAAARLPARERLPVNHVDKSAFVPCCMEPGAAPCSSGLEENRGSPCSGFRSFEGGDIQAQRSPSPAAPVSPASLRSALRCFALPGAGDELLSQPLPLQEKENSLAQPPQ